MAKREAHLRLVTTTTEPKGTTSEAPAWPNRDIPERYRGWELSNYPKPAERAIRKWLNDRESWLLYLRGALGTRKSSIAAATLKLWRSRFNPGVGGYDVGFFVSIGRLVERARDPERKNLALETCKNTRLLVLDDIGASRSTDFVKEMLRFVLFDRYDRKAKTILTTNLTVLQFGNQICPRLADRFKEGFDMKCGKASKR